jgi:hypothetical protein
MSSDFTSVMTRVVVHKLPQTCIDLSIDRTSCEQVVSTRTPARQL